MTEIQSDGSKYMNVYLYVCLVIVCKRLIVSASLAITCYLLKQDVVNEPQCVSSSLIKDLFCLHCNMILSLCYSNLLVSTSNSWIFQQGNPKSELK